MTPEERHDAAAVMASDGPWDIKPRRYPCLHWAECDGEPKWNWECFTYRVRPLKVTLEERFDQ